MTLRSITPREASIFACLVDTYCAPAGDFPEVRETSAVEFFDESMCRAPWVNRLSFRAMLMCCELGPRLTGYGARFRQLDRERRAEFALRIEKSTLVPLRSAANLFKAATSLGYYGDREVARLVGYDADANLERGRRIRREEGRP